MKKVEYKDQFRVVPTKCRTGWRVVDGKGVTCGPMRHFYSELNDAPVPMSILRHPYPPELRMGNQEPMDKETAMDVLKRLKEHIEAVLELPKNKRIGSSEWWDRQVIID